MKITNNDNGLKQNFRNKIVNVMMIQRTKKSGKGSYTMRGLGTHDE